MERSTHSGTEARTAAALVIGNELLAGRVQEANVAYLGRSLRQLGMVLRRVVICADEVAAIVTDLDALRSAHDVVFTSGGVGPTHDDVTLDAVAQAFGRERVRFEALEQLLRDHFGGRLTEAHLLMADLPVGAQLIAARPGRWPTVCVGNVFVLPGVPSIFRAKVDDLRSVLGGGRPFVTRALETHLDEGQVAPLLARVVAEHPRVEVGSYPQVDGGRFRLRVTVDGQIEEAVDAALDALRASLGDDAHEVDG